MGSAVTIPKSNPAGNNQTGPPGLNQGKGSGGVIPVVSGVPSFNPTNPVQSLLNNPLVPAASTVPSSTTASVPNAGGLIDNTSNVPGTTGALQKQETDMYGKGVGGAISTLLGSIGGVDSATLQEFIKSLLPQEATAKANLDASLGAAGVSGNSSVAAIGEANLQAQETGAIAGEEANLTQSGENLEASILTGQQSAAADEVASSGWDTFAQVLKGVGTLAGDTVGAAGKVGGFSELFS